MSMDLEFYINNPWYGPPWYGFLLILFGFIVLILGLGFLEKRGITFLRMQRNKKEEEEIEE